MPVITYGPSKMGYDPDLKENYFTIELLVDGRNSGMFVNRDIFKDLKRFINDLKDDPLVKSAYIRTTMGKLISNALFEVDENAVIDFILNEINKAK